MGTTDQNSKREEEHLIISKPLRLILLRNGNHVLRSLFFIIGFSSQTQILQHNMTDQELFTKISSLSSSSWFWRRHNNDEKMVVKVAFMFLTGGGLPLADLWDKFFEGHEGFYSIYVHTNPSFQEHYPETSVFYSRRIPGQAVYWGTSTMVDAERRLLANALLDESNQRFVLLSDSCIPLFNFTTIYE
ncbi:BnaC09g41650D [Brassica napus]|uniref:BnaC09g41650D protein n=1 Tax=Brassica napus TaxID=3708 RepID=A0A078GPC2_BRANA|nr:BnaC09g41650D [Brassica napus]